MSSHVLYDILNYPVTPLPSIIGKLAGTPIDNGVCNGAFWLFLLWTVYHAIFDVIVHKILMKYEFKKYIITRLTNSIWFITNFVVFFSFAIKIVARYRLDLINWNAKFLHAYKSPPTDVSVGILVLCLFYLHMTMYQATKLDYSESVLKYFLLSVIYFLAYINRKIEVPLILATFICATEIITEITRISFCITKDKEHSWLKNTAKGLFVLNHLFWVATYIVIIPLRLVLSPAKRIWYDFKISQAILILALIVWFVVNLYDSVLLKWFSHWLEYGKEEKYNLFREPAIDFALFNSRKDSAFYWKLLRSEMKTREDEMISRRKPKNRNVLFQTIKCMLAIKKKMNIKKGQEEDSDGSNEKDSDEDSEETEEQLKSTIDLQNADSAKEGEAKDDSFQEGKLVIKLQKSTKPSPNDNGDTSEECSPIRNTVEVQPVLDQSENNEA